MTLLEAVSPTARALLKGGSSVASPHRKNNGGASVPASRGSSVASPHRPSPFDVAMRRVLFPQRMMCQARAIIIVGNEPDERLGLLASRLAAVSGNVSSLAMAEPSARAEAAMLLRVSLADLAAYALIWATTGQRNYVRGCKAIAAERERQRALFLAKRIAFDCASPVVDPRRKFRVLFKECGEVARAINQIEHHGLAEGNLHMELTHVAAVCVAWLEALEVEGNGMNGRGMTADSVAEHSPAAKGATR